MLFPRLPNSKSTSAYLKRAGDGDTLGWPSCVPLCPPLVTLGSAAGTFSPRVRFFWNKWTPSSAWNCPTVPHPPDPRDNASQSGPTPGKVPSFPCSWLWTRSAGSGVGWYLHPGSFFLGGAQPRELRKAPPMMDASGLFVTHSWVKTGSWALSTTYLYLLLGVLLSAIYWCGS